MKWAERGPQYLNIRNGVRWLRLVAVNVAVVACLPTPAESTSFCRRKSAGYSSMSRWTAVASAVPWRIWGRGWLAPSPQGWLEWDDSVLGLWS